jgi:hypothetical protein
VPKAAGCCLGSAAGQGAALQGCQGRMSPCMPKNAAICSQGQVHLAGVAGGPMSNRARTLRACCAALVSGLDNEEPERAIV